MALSPPDRRLIAAIADGLPLAPQPYEALAAALGRTEADVLAALDRLVRDGTIRRLGLVVRHHELGYRANVMVAWDVAEEEISRAGRRLAALPFVSLCYRRQPRPPRWPYALFCMIHGRDRGAVSALVEDASRAAGLAGLPRAILFSRRRFTQRGARYGMPAAEPARPGAVP